MAKVPGFEMSKAKDKKESGEVQISSDLQLTIDTVDSCTKDIHTISEKILKWSKGKKEKEVAESIKGELNKFFGAYPRYIFIEHFNMLVSAGFQNKCEALNDAFTKLQNVNESENFIPPDWANGIKGYIADLENFLSLSIEEFAPKKIPGGPG